MAEAEFGIVGVGFCAVVNTETGEEPSEDERTYQYVNPWEYTENPG